MQEKEEKYIQLYKTQNKILNLTAKEKLGFYLTGGTALQRFHYNNFRFSDDLDFFLINNEKQDEMPKEFDEFLTMLKDNNIEHTIKVSNKYFTQIYLKENDLKIDLVNDFVYHEKNDFKKLDNGLYIDSIQNIFVNKLETSISRDEPRDLFDIYTILSNNKMDIDKSFEILTKKCNIEPKDIILNLKNVNLDNVNLEEIRAKNNYILKDFCENFHKVINENFIEKNQKKELFEKIDYFKKKKDILISDQKDKLIKDISNTAEKLYKNKELNQEEKQNIDNIINQSRKLYNGKKI
ncbi:nucleotidyl transferase AbiEii/AbiGii toxin family protein [Campylobacter lari]|nr:nucleotidyl transferase AbiEii/AbiGii toxin family protein [Campylobacter lari]HED1004873.1 nucleotidyl transferase AbiEii/AbiGii toxin family protein [Campylobacter jejuni]